MSKVKKKGKTGAGAGAEMEMNFSRAVTVVKSQCPKEWGRRHAQALDGTRKSYGLPGVYVQLLMLLDAVEDWVDDYGAVAFLRQWTEKHREEAEHVA